MSLLRWGLLAVCGGLAALTYSLWRDIELGRLYAQTYWGPATEYIAMTLTVVLAGAAVMDVLVKRYK